MPDNRDWTTRIKAATFSEAINILAEYGNVMWRAGETAGFRRGYDKGKTVDR